MLPRTLDAPVSQLRDLGEPTAKRLPKLAIETIRDLLLALPFDWETYGEPVGVDSLVVGTQATVIGTVERIAPKVTKFKRMKLTEETIRDDRGSRTRGP